jgi:hypothetical protein
MLAAAMGLAAEPLLDAEAGQVLPAPQPIQYAPPAQPGPAPASTSAPAAAEKAAPAPAATATAAPAPAGTADAAEAARKAKEESLRKAREAVRLRQVLREPQPALEFNATPAKDALNMLAEAGHFNIVVDSALAEAGIDLAARTVTLKVRGMPAEDALTLILPGECGWRVEAGYVLVTTLAKSWLPLETRLYSVLMALAEVPNFIGPRFQLADLPQIAAAQQGGAGLPIAAAPAAPPDTGQATPDRLIAMIKQLVKTQNDRRIAPWDDEGGPATIQYLNGHIVVAQTEEGHRAVARILTMVE